MNKLKNHYEAVIIGGGISGLVCSCYLAKAGMDVLVIEKNSKVGGYCSCIEGKKYKFNLTTTMIGGNRNSTLDKVYHNELNLSSKLTFFKERFSNSIVTEDGIFAFDTTGHEVLSKLKKMFFKEEIAIDAFYKLIVSSKPLELYLSYKNKTFGELLDSFFSCEKIKKLFMIPCGIFGILPSKISAFSAILYYRETIFSDNCSIAGGAEKLPEMLADELIKNRGKLLLNAQVVKVNTAKDRTEISSVTLSNGKTVKTKYLIACCDAKNLFLNLLDKDSVDTSFKNSISNLSITSSAVIVFLGLNRPVDGCIEKYKSRNIWYCPNYDVIKCYENIENKEQCDNSDYFLCYLSSSSCSNSLNQIAIYRPAPFKDNVFWEKNSKTITEELIIKAGSIFKNLSSNIEHKVTITPTDLYRYTFNCRGAIKGWASIPIQNDPKIIPQRKIFKNLYIGGQWSTMEPGQGGIPMVSFSGRKVAKLILKDSRGVK
ncbi:MAG: NAD(P)/FAD-dependent oxidoreductase [Candidatus Omnitrophica bacterium]|nr:NAD(P)/FAD-dependent oxidoreductase [Candidatus Omnitrophota bacterium]